MANGTLIVLEGVDGSGKSTQFQLLCEHLTAQGTPYQRLVFPQYDQPSSALVRMYLNGAFGSHPTDVNPYAASTFYAVDRYAAWKSAWEAPYRAGGLILSDRYATSNAVHQGSKLPPEEQEDFFDWLADLEYKRFGLPRPDLVLYLDMPVERSAELLRAREFTTHTKGDIHETDWDYQMLCRQTACRASAYYGWTPISCTDTAGALRSVGEIQTEIWDRVSQVLAAQSRPLPA